MKRIEANFNKEKGRLSRETESPYAGTLPNPAESGKGEFSSEQLHPFAFDEIGPCRVEVVLPSDAGFAEVEHVFFFHAMHPVNNGMADLRQRIEFIVIRPPSALRWLQLLWFCFRS